MNLTVSPPTIQPAPQRKLPVSLARRLFRARPRAITFLLPSAPLPVVPFAAWSASAPNQFVTSAANASTTDLGAASDGKLVCLPGKGTIEIRAADLSLTSVPTSTELEQIPGRVLVPGVALHPSGALIYEPFLTGASGGRGSEGRHRHSRRPFGARCVYESFSLNSS